MRIHNLIFYIMKRVKHITLAALITVIGCGVLQAQENTKPETLEANSSKVQIVQSQAQKYKLVYPIKKSGLVWVKIFDSDDKMLLSEKVKNKEGFMRSYDFSYLPEGKYRINIESEEGILNKEVYHEYQKNDISISVEETYHDNAFRLIVKGVKESPVYVDIFDGDNNVIFEDVVDVGKSFSRIYKFYEGVPADLMISVAQDDKKIFTEIK